MAEKKNPKPDDPEQSKRFLETAKEIAGPDDEARFDSAVKAITQPRSGQGNKPANSGSNCNKDG